MKEFFSNVLIIMGILFLITGILIKLFPSIGNLPGDITIKGKNYVIYIPVATSIFLSIFLTFVLNLIIHFFRK